MYRLQIKQKHIKTGKPNHPCRCPVALAVAEDYGIESNDDNADFVTVDGSYIEVVKDGIATASFECSKKISKFIADVDEGKKVKPSVFCLKECGT